MRRRGLGMLGLMMAAGLTAAGLAQERGPVTPAAHVAPAAPPAKGRDVGKWPVGQQQFYLSAQRGADWLRRANKLDGRFVFGFLPALSRPMDGDDYAIQAEAAAALARAGRYFGDDGATAIARQALLTLLHETTTDPADPQAVRPAAPPQLVDHLATSGALVLAIHELAGAGKDLLEKGDGLCLYLRRHQRADGAFVVAESGADPRTEASVAAAGVALHGIIHSQAQRPAAWKLDLVRKARGYYQGVWQQTRSLPLAVSHTPAYAEAYLLTKDQGYADLAFAMADWLCGLQYRQLEAGRQHWAGGFQPWKHGKATAAAPDVTTAACAASLAAACRAAKQAGDLPRYQRYRQALEGSLLFLTGLQYTPARARHFVEDFRPAVVGAFHASHQDGDLRLDHTARPLGALVAYLEHVAEE